MRTACLLVLSLLSVAPTASAVDNPPAEAVPGELVPTVYAESTVVAPRETELAYRVESAVADLPGLRCGDVHAHVLRGVVTLAGAVPGRRTHDRVVLATSTVDGVRLVRDQLRIEPLCAVEAMRPGAPQDDRVRRALSGLHQRDGRPVEVTVENDRVVLAGEMARWDDARSALAAARSAARFARIHTVFTVPGNEP